MASQQPIASQHPRRTIPAQRSELHNFFRAVARYLPVGCSWKSAAKVFITFLLKIEISFPRR